MPGSSMSGCFGLLEAEANSRGGAGVVVID
jgi:hypothetical protein